MKKYLPISAVLLAFFSLVFLKNSRPDDDDNIAVGKNNSQPSGSDSKPTPTVSNSGNYRDGIFTGSLEDAYYGNYQVGAVINNGKITDINFLVYPNDNRTSRSINSQAMVYLKAEAIQIQSAQVDIVSGASSSSEAFIRSLSSALKKAAK